MRARLDRCGQPFSVEGERDGLHALACSMARRARRGGSAARSHRLSPRRQAPRERAAGQRSRQASGLPRNNWRASANTTGRLSVAPRTARQTERAGSNSTAPIALANSPVFRHTL